MKHIFAYAALVLFASTAGAQIPPPTTLSYQGVLLDGGSPVADGSHTIQISLFSTSTGGTATYIESHNATTEDGVFSVEIGGGAPITGIWTDVEFDQAWWVETVADGNLMSPRTTLLAAPYARSLVTPARLESSLTDTTLVVSNTAFGSAGRPAIYGLVESTSTFSASILGESLSGNGIGVHGISPDEGVRGEGSRGVVGLSTVPGGFAILGYSSAQSGLSYGVSGETESPTGRGVYGLADTQSGTNYAVYAEARSSEGRAVYGIATRTAGFNYGGYFQTSSVAGTGVYGYASASSTLTTYGVHGRSHSSNGRALFGDASATSGSTYGVWGQSASSTFGRGVFGWATSTGSGSTTGVYGQSASTNGRGVFGSANASSGATRGVYGTVSSATGFAGYFTKNVSGNGGAATAYVVEVANTSSSTSPDVLALSVGTSGDPGTAINYVGFFDGDDDLIGQIEGNDAGGISYNTTGADYAERLPKLIESEQFVSGDVVGVFGGRVSQRTIGAERVMVVSSNPAVVGNSSGDVSDNPAVAFIGQVDVRVSGSVNVGDILVASGLEDGTAVAVSPEDWNPAVHGAPIGRAWEPRTGSGESPVNAAVGVDDLAGIVARLAAQQEELRSLRAAVEALKGQHTETANNRR